VKTGAFHSKEFEFELFRAVVNFSAMLK